MKKRLSAKQAVELIPDGAVIMCGGFLGCGTAHRLMDALAASQKKNLTIICNDAGTIGRSEWRSILWCGKADS